MKIVTLEIRPDDGTIVIAGNVAQARRVRRELRIEGRSATKRKRANRKKTNQISEIVALHPPAHLLLERGLV
jgi:hypothetical protein